MTKVENGSPPYLEWTLEGEYRLQMSGCTHYLDLKRKSWLLHFNWAVLPGIKMASSKWSCEKYLTSVLFVCLFAVFVFFSASCLFRSQSSFRAYLKSHLLIPTLFLKLNFFNAHKQNIKTKRAFKKSFLTALVLIDFPLYLEPTPHN